jgi:hypothetical protein
MERGLVARYEELVDEDSSATVLRAQISQILCVTGNRAIVELMQALQTKQMEAAGKLAALAANLFEPAIALTNGQIGGYNGLAALCALVGKRAESHDYARRGLAELEEMRRDPAAQAMSKSTVFPPDIDDQAEQILRSYLQT